MAGCLPLHSKHRCVNRQASKQGFLLFHSLQYFLLSAGVFRLKDQGTTGPKLTAGLLRYFGSLGTFFGPCSFFTVTS